MKILRIFLFLIILNSNLFSIIIESKYPPVTCEFSKSKEKVILSSKYSKKSFLFEILRTCDSKIDPVVEVELETELLSCGFFKDENRVFLVTDKSIYFINLQQINVSIKKIFDFNEKLNLSDLDTTLSGNKKYLLIQNKCEKRLYIISQTGNINLINLDFNAYITRTKYLNNFLPIVSNHDTEYSKYYHINFEQAQLKEINKLELMLLNFFSKTLR